MVPLSFSLVTGSTTRDSAVMCVCEGMIGEAVPRRLADRVAGANCMPGSDRCSPWTILRIHGLQDGAALDLEADLLGSMMC